MQLTQTPTTITPTPVCIENVSIFTQARVLASQNRVSELEQLWSSVTSPDRQAFSDLALIGASDTKAKEAGQWALKHGACELWGIQQEPNPWHKVNAHDTNEQLKMKNGPGEVKKGSFASRFSRK